MPATEADHRALMSKPPIWVAHYTQDFMYAISSLRAPQQEYDWYNTTAGDGAPNAGFMSDVHTVRVRRGLRKLYELEIEKMEARGRKPRGERLLKDYFKTVWGTDWRGDVMDHQNMWELADVVDGVHSGIKLKVVTSEGLVNKRDKPLTEKSSYTMRTVDICLFDSGNCTIDMESRAGDFNYARNLETLRVSGMGRRLRHAVADTLAVFDMEVLHNRNCSDSYLPSPDQEQVQEMA